MLLTAVTAIARTHLYRGNSTYTSDILYTWDGRRLYHGNSTYTSNVLLTIAQENLYSGNSTYASDILYTINGTIPVPVLIMLM